MIDENPDDLVREGQHGADDTAAGTGKTKGAAKAEEKEPVEEELKGSEEPGNTEEGTEEEQGTEPVEPDEEEVPVPAEEASLQQDAPDAGEGSPAEEEPAAAGEETPAKEEPVEAEEEPAAKEEPAGATEETTAKDEPVEAAEVTPAAEESAEAEQEVPEPEEKTTEEKTEAHATEEQPAAHEEKPAPKEKPARVHRERVQAGEEIHATEDTGLPPVDYSGLSKNELVETLGLIVDNRPPSEIRDDVERIKSFFYKKTKQEAEERKAKFLESGGKIEEYKSWVDPLDYRVKELLEKFREKKNDYNKVQEAEKYENLKKKYDIIDRIKDLVNREESINKTFHDFRMLQNDWHSIGVVPQASLKDLWENYHHSVEVFYDYIKINKELRDLDLRKNLEAKIALCEKAEQLMLEPNPVNAFRILQELHDQWREIGPVPPESKNEIWERFREATSQINRRHHEYFEKQKDDQRKNLDSKIALCEEVEAINASGISNFRDFDEKAEKIVALQKMWRTIGFAPKKQNNRVYQRFREACDTFFEKKRSFYSDNKETQLNNLQLKTELCMQAESLQESTDWKSTSDALIKLQREWKEIGPVPRKQSEKTWKRFRKACDHFFNKKSEYFANLDTSYEDNLNAKLAIIDELEKFEPGTDVQAAFDRL
ncbi:MAG: DUF349 domain-containing protein [Bacteroidales bacterium]